MCRWVAYFGKSIPLETLITEPKNSLIIQSQAAKMGIHPTNADGVGVGWYGRNNEPGTYHSVLPAWGDQNLIELAHHIESPIFMGHVRHSTGTPVQSTNCHPFKYTNWLFVHNGLIRGFQAIRRELTLAIDPQYFTSMKGNTDSEIIFYLALTFGLKQDPIGAMEKAVGYVEKIAKANGTEFPLQASFAISDGDRLYAIRYSSEGDSRTLFHSADPEVAKELVKNSPRAGMFKDAQYTRAVVSEPLGDISDMWVPVDEATAIIISKEGLEYHDFNPKQP